jgi:hypothetical protein
MDVDTLDPFGRVRTVKRPIYYISEVLHDAKTWYLVVHKLLYAVLIASKKLHHYFHGHKISVVSSYPPRAVFYNPNATDNITKWAAEPAEFELEFIPHRAVKIQVLADFVADWTPPPCQPLGPHGGKPEPSALVFTGPHWTLFFDGSSQKQGSSAGILLLILTAEQFSYVVHLYFKATNNKTEYEALIFGLSTAVLLGVRQLLV